MSFEYDQFNFDQPHQPTMAEIEQFFEDTTDEYKIVPRPSDSSDVKQLTGSLGEGAFEQPLIAEEGV